MRFETSQHMKMGQHMKLAPRMIQSMEILQMPLAELEERIERELESNATLEVAEGERSTGLWFAAFDGTDRELWRIDGTTKTQIDLNPAGSSTPGSLTAAGDRTSPPLHCVCDHSVAEPADGFAIGISPILQTSITAFQWGRHGYDNGQMPANGTGNPDRH